MLSSLIKLYSNSVQSIYNLSKKPNKLYQVFMLVQFPILSMHKVAAERNDSPVTENKTTSRTCLTKGSYLPQPSEDLKGKGKDANEYIEISPKLLSQKGEAKC